GTAVMQQLSDFVPAFSHHLKPLPRDRSQFACMFLHPGINGWIPLDSSVEPQQFRCHRLSTFRFLDLWLGRLHDGWPIQVEALSGCRRPAAEIPSEARDLLTGAVLRFRNRGAPSLRISRCRPT